MRRLARRGQSSVETLLLISVFVVAIVGVAAYFTSENGGIVAGFKSMAAGAENAYVNPSN